MVPNVSTISRIVSIVWFYVARCYNLIYLLIKYVNLQVNNVLYLDDHVEQKSSRIDVHVRDGNDNSADDNRLRQHRHRGRFPGRTGTSVHL